MPTILIVEDESLIADILVAILREEDYKVIVTINGKEALKKLESIRPDLILSDIMMPMMDGRELCHRLQDHPEYRSIPVILMSAAYGSANLDGCTYSALIRKPFDIEDLLAAIAKYAKP